MAIPLPQLSSTSTTTTSSTTKSTTSLTPLSRLLFTDQSLQRITKNVEDQPTTVDSLVQMIGVDDDFNSTAGVNASTSTFVTTTPKDDVLAWVLDVLPMMAAVAGIALVGCIVILLTFMVCTKMKSGKNNRGGGGRSWCWCCGKAATTADVERAPTAFMTDSSKTNGGDGSRNGAARTANDDILRAGGHRSGGQATSIRQPSTRLPPLHREQLRTALADTGTGNPPVYGGLRGVPMTTIPPTQSRPLPSRPREL